MRAFVLSGSVFPCQAKRSCRVGRTTTTQSIRKCQQTVCLSRCNEAASDTGRLNCRWGWEELTGRQRGRKSWGNDGNGIIIGGGNYTSTRYVAALKTTKLTSDRVLNMVTP